MLIDGKPTRSINIISDYKISIIDQTLLPHRLEYKILSSLEDSCIAIKNMLVRGAPLIGITAAYGMALSIKNDSSDKNLLFSEKKLLESRPTAVDLKWYINKVKEGVINLSIDKRFEEAWNISCKLAEESILQCSKIGDLGKDLILKNFKNKQVINILTHCNAGWLACIDWGTALAPIYKLYDQGVKVHVWVDETRPRSQGAFLTTWELSKHGVPNTLIVDNAGGHLMQSGKVDMCIVGSDRTAANGDVCNKIGTYLKALSAYDNDVPFYVALPETTIDLSLSSGINKIPIEERSSREVTHLMGVGTKGETIEVRLSEKNINIFNPGFDVTPNKYVTKLITNRGVCEASKEGINKLFK